MSSTATIIENALKEGRKHLNEIESKHLLNHAGVPTSETRLARTRDEASSIAAEIGFPVALKIMSPDILHKSDIGGVKLGLGDNAAVANAYDDVVAAVSSKQPRYRIDGVSVQRMAEPGLEVIVGVSSDPQFGRVVMFGVGGVLVELFKDVSFRIVPITLRDAHQMMGEIKGNALLHGYRGSAAVNVEAIADVLLKVSAFAAMTPQVCEIDLNPIFARPHDAIAVDARVILA